MLRYEKIDDEMIYDVPAKTHLVFDVCCSGLMNLSPLYERFRLEFPISFQKYLEACIKGTVKPGDVMVLKENSRSIALTFIRNNRKDEPEQVIKYIDAAFYNLYCVLNMNEDSTFASGIIERHSGLWTLINPIISAYDFNWTVHRK